MIKLPYSDREKQLEYLREYRRKQREKARENRPPIETKQGSLDKLEDEYAEHVDELEGYIQAFDPDHQRQKDISIIPDRVLNPPSHSKPNSDSPMGRLGISGDSDRGGAVAICSVCGTKLDSKGRCSTCSPNQQSTDVQYQQALTNSDKEMNAEQYEAQNQPKPPEAGKSPDVDSWLRTH